LTIFYLIRHAEIEWGPGDPVLTPAGRSQAIAVGEYLRDGSVTRIYSSPLHRALETANLIAQAVDAPVFIDPRLRERMNWGDVADQNWAEFEAEWERASSDRDYVPLGGLSANQAAANLSDFLSETARLFTGDALAAVTHGGILGDYLAEHFLPQDLSRLNMDWKTRQGEAITHCSITTLRWDANGPHLESLAVVVKP